MITDFDFGFILEAKIKDNAKEFYCKNNILLNFFII